MKKKKLTTAIATVFVAGISLATMSACNVERFTYDDAGKYSVGAASAMGKVTNLEIDWVTGNISVAYGDVENVTFSEKSEEALTDENTVHYWLENSTLHIKYAKSGIKLNNTNQPEKDLTVVLPTALILNGLEIDSVDADISLTDIQANDVDIDNVAGNLDATFDSVREFSVSVVSGDATMRFATAPADGEYSNVHGDLTMYLPEGTGFTLEVEKLMGGFESEFDTVKQGNTYVCGNGANEYEFETVDGKVAVKKLA